MNSLDPKNVAIDQANDSTSEPTQEPTTVQNEPISDHALPRRPDHTLTLNKLLQGLGEMILPNRDDAHLNAFQDCQQLSNPQLIFVASLLVSMGASSQNHQQHDTPTGEFLPGGSSLDPVVLGTLQHLSSSSSSAAVKPQDPVKGLSTETDKLANTRTAERQSLVPAPAPQARVSTPPIFHPNTDTSSSTSNSPFGRKLKTVPCRARGLASDHNATTAYFIIPNDICHAGDLICSHPECRSRGIKFRYCAFCGIPVARRTFRQRHHHGGAVTTPSVAGSSSNNNINNNNNNKGTVKDVRLPKTVVTERRVTPEPSDGGGHVSHHGTSRVTDDALSMPTTFQLSPPQADDAIDGTKRSYEDTINNESRSTDPKPKRQRLEFPDGLPENIRFRHRKSSSVKHQQIESDHSTTDHEHTEKVSVDDSLSMDDEEYRLIKWTSLLHERPSLGDHDGMSAWIIRVLLVSDMSVPCRPRRQTRREGISETGSSMTSTYADTEESYEEDAQLSPHHQKREKQECSRDYDEYDAKKLGMKQWKRPKSSLEREARRESSSETGSGMDSSCDTEEIQEDTPAASYHRKHWKSHKSSREWRRRDERKQKRRR